MKKQNNAKCCKNNGVVTTQFFKIPKALITDEKLSLLSDGAKLLYSLLLDRTSLSYKNGWIDRENQVYIIYTTESIMKNMKCANGKATKLKKELIKAGLIRVKKRGQGNPDYIYVVDYVPNNNKSAAFPKKSGYSMSRNSKLESLNMRMSRANNTKENKTDLNKTKSSSDDDSILLSQIIENACIEDLAKAAQSNEEKIIIDTIMESIKRIIVSGSNLRYRTDLINNSDVVKVYQNLEKTHIVNIIDRVLPKYNSISNLINYIEVALYCEAHKTGAPRKNTFAYSSERHHSKEYYNDLMRDITS